MQWPQARVYTAKPFGKEYQLSEQPCLATGTIDSAETRLLGSRHPLWRGVSVGLSSPKLLPPTGLDYRMACYWRKLVRNSFCCNVTSTLSGPGTWSLYGANSPAILKRGCRAMPLDRWASCISRFPRRTWLLMEHLSLVEHVSMICVTCSTCPELK